LSSALQLASHGVKLQRSVQQLLTPLEIEFGMLLALTVSALLYGIVTTIL
jgi:hypothetical protein